MYAPIFLCQSRYLSLDNSSHLQYLSLYQIYNSRIMIYDQLYICMYLNYIMDIIYFKLFKIC